MGINIAKFFRRAFTLSRARREQLKAVIIAAVDEVKDIAKEMGDEAAESAKDAIVAAVTAAVRKGK